MRSSGTPASRRCSRARSLIATQGRPGGDDPGAPGDEQCSRPPAAGCSPTPSRRPGGPPRRSRAQRLARVRGVELGDVRDVEAPERALQPDEVVERAGEAADEALTQRREAPHDVGGADQTPRLDPQGVGVERAAARAEGHELHVGREVRQLPRVEVGTSHDGHAHSSCPLPGYALDDEARHRSGRAILRAMTDTALRGARHDAYESTRPDVQALVPASARRILDLGCAAGHLGAALKQRQAAEVVGIELDEDYAVDARERLDLVVQGDVSAVLRDSAPELGSFDCLIAADVLEHSSTPGARCATRLRCWTPAERRSVAAERAIRARVLAADPPGPLATRARRPVRRDALALVHPARRAGAARAAGLEVIAVDAPLLVRAGRDAWRWRSRGRRSRRSSPVSTSCSGAGAG